MPQNCSIITSCSITCIGLFHVPHPRCCHWPPDNLTSTSQHNMLHCTAPAGHLRLRVHATADSGGEAGAVGRQCQCAAAGPLGILGPAAVLAALCSQPGPPAPTCLASCQSVPSPPPFLLVYTVEPCSTNQNMECHLPFAASSLGTTLVDCSMFPPSSMSK